MFTIRCGTVLTGSSCDKWLTRLAKILTLACAVQCEHIHYIHCQESSLILVMQRDFQTQHILNPSASVWCGQWQFWRLESSRMMSNKHKNYLESTLYTVPRTSMTASFGSAIRTWKRNTAMGPGLAKTAKSTLAAIFCCKLFLYLPFCVCKNIQWCFMISQTVVISCEDRPGEHHLTMENDIESHIQFTQFQVWSFLHHPAVKGHFSSSAMSSSRLMPGVGLGDPKMSMMQAPVGHHGSINNIWRKLQTHDGLFNVNWMYT